MSPTRQKLHRVVCKLILIGPQRARVLLKRAPEIPQFDGDTSCQREEFPNLVVGGRLSVYHPDGHDVQFSPDGSRFAVSKLNGRLSIWDITDLGKKQRMVLHCPTGRFSWLADSVHIAIIMKDGIKFRNTSVVS